MEDAEECEEPGEEWREWDDKVGEWVAEDAGECDWEEERETVVSSK